MYLQNGGDRLNPKKIEDLSFMVTIQNDLVLQGEKWNLVSLKVRKVIRVSDGTSLPLMVYYN